MSDALYRTSATNIGGTQGTTDISDGLRLTTANPGHPEDGTNPEQLLAAAWATCLGETVRAVLRRHELADHDSSVTAAVELHQLPNGEYEFHPAATILLAGFSADQAAEIARTADARCPVSKQLSAAHVSWEIIGTDMRGDIR